MSIPALRQSVQNIIGDRIADHPGLSLFKYHPYQDENDHKEKDKTLYKAVHNINGNDSTFTLYKHAFDRWEEGLKTDSPWSEKIRLKAKDRLFIGLGNASVLEFGASLHHIYGFPQIPGSSLKGLCAYYADEVWGSAEKDWKIDGKLHQMVFGNPDTEGIPASAGAIDFLDAWWVPEKSGMTPFVIEIINCHHTDYYTKNETVPPADWEQPIPVKILAVSGSFLFSIRGPAYWNKLILLLISEAVSSWGIGGKTRAGYGRFIAPKPAEKPAQTEIWEGAYVKYTPNNGVITAAWEGKKAETSDKEVIPQQYHKKLFQKREGINLKVEAEVYGNAFRLVKVWYTIPI